MTISTPPSGNSLLRFAPDIDLRQYPIDATLASTMFPKSNAMSPKLTARKTFGRPRPTSHRPVPPGLAGRVEQCKTTTPTCQRSESRFLFPISNLFLRPYCGRGFSASLFISCYLAMRSGDVKCLAVSDAPVLIAVYVCLFGFW